MNSKFTVMVFGGIKDRGEMAACSLSSKSKKDVQILFFSQKALFSSSNSTPVSGVAFFWE